MKPTIMTFVAVVIVVALVGVGVYLVVSAPTTPATTTTTTTPATATTTTTPATATTTTTPATATTTTTPATATTTTTPATATTTTTTTTTPATTTTPTPTQYIKIGSNTALNHAYCVECTQGQTLAVEDINAEGGLHIGDQNYLLQFISYDGRMLNDESVANVRRLLEVDGVRHLVFLGPSSCTMAAMPYVQEFIAETGEDIVLMASGTGTTDLCVNYGSSIAFRERPTGYETGKMHTRFVIETYGPKFGVLISNDANGLDEVRGIQESAARYGGQIVSIEYYQYGEVDVTSQLTKLMDLQPTTIIIAHHPTYTVDFAKQAFNLGAKEKGIHIHILGDAPLAQVTTTIGVERAEGLTCEIPSAYPVYLQEGVPEVVAFAEKIEERFGMPIGGGHPCGYTAVMILGKAMEIAGTTDVTAVKSVLRNMKISDVEDELWFKINPLSPVDAAGHIYNAIGQGSSQYTVAIFHNVDGTLEQVPLQALEA